MPFVKYIPSHLGNYGGMVKGKDDFFSFVGFLTDCCYMLPQTQ